MARGVNQSGLAGRVLALWPVWLMYVALAVGVAMGRVLQSGDTMTYFRWFAFFLASFSALYCVPFGFLVGMVAQLRVWYTARYAHRFIGVATLVMLAVMLYGWSPWLFKHPDPTYVLAVVWPTLASGLFMQLGMFMVRRNEYEQAASDSGVDDYDDLEEWEEELNEEAGGSPYAYPDGQSYDQQNGQASDRPVDDYPDAGDPNDDLGFGEPADADRPAGDLDGMYHGGTHFRDDFDDYFDAEEPDDDSLESLGLTTRIVNVLGQAGVSGAHQLADMSDDELLAIRGVGKASLERIHEALGR